MHNNGWCSETVYHVMGECMNYAAKGRMSRFATRIVYIRIWNDSEQNCTTAMLCFPITFSAYLHEKHDNQISKVLKKAAQHGGPWDLKKFYPFVSNFQHRRLSISRFSSFLLQFDYTFSPLSITSFANLCFRSHKADLLYLALCYLTMCPDSYCSSQK